VSCCPQPTSRKRAAPALLRESLSWNDLRADKEAVKIELNDPRFVPALREYLQRRGCPSELRGEETFEVRVLQPAGTVRSEGSDREKIFSHLREWCADHPGVQANLLD
jgi:hypothetical protein